MVKGRKGWWIWELDRFCPCNHCRGGKNKHAWSFYYYLKRCGDQPRHKVTKDQILIAIRPLKTAAPTQDEPAEGKPPQPPQPA